ncbi:aminodeoxychorismate synthase component I [Tellurirhabdus rosea]|uniref:aminodeoxychorismate synthase component I n=1 Tax=Tellurirhabdus rosea TaxID=2674997 RepID=UPI00224D9818|nr:aminodeoxychorismate synthase component I [Tellurirhabdus rosea]
MNPFGVRDGSREVMDGHDPEWRWKALRWACHEAVRRQQPFTFLNNNGLSYPGGPFPNRLMVGTRRDLRPGPGDFLNEVQAAFRERPSCLAGFLTYDFKNRLEALESRHSDHLALPDGYFYEPAYRFDFGADRVVVAGPEPEAVLDQIDRTAVPASASLSPTVSVRCRVSREEYLANVRRIREHILAGDVYELNYCMEFYAENVRLDPFALYCRLNERSPMPFSVFQKVGDVYLMGASPERFLKKEGTRLVSQPIKGTIRRGQTPGEDEQLKEALRNNEKEQAENLMIVDLVRNDLARSAETGSVRVEELFGIYTFRQVHQMISTVSATLRPDVPFTDAIRHAFPMGSMTGAPKVRAMELIEQYEASRRGLYSGTVGYITPEGDFDFNVVIRSMLYNARTGYLSFSVGSAITFDADPAAEYDECLLKASAMLAVLV